MSKGDARRIVAIGESEELATQVRAWLLRFANEPARWEVAFAPFERPPYLSWVRGASLVVVDGRRSPLVAAAECGRLRALEVPVALLVTEQGLVAALVERGDVRWVLSALDDDENLVRTLASTEASEAAMDPTRESGRDALSVRIDRARRTVWVDGRETRLPAQKFELLCYFWDRNGVAVSAHELVRAGLLRPSQVQRYRGLIAELKNRLGPARGRLRSVPGYGYIWDAPQSR